MGIVGFTKRAQTNAKSLKATVRHLFRRLIRSIRCSSVIALLLGPGYADSLQKVPVASKRGGGAERREDWKDTVVEWRILDYDTFRRNSKSKRAYSSGCSCCTQ